MKPALKVSLIVAAFIFCGVVFRLNLYRYDKMGGLPVRINRITGAADSLYASGWKRMEPSPAPAIDKR